MMILLLAVPGNLYAQAVTNAPANNPHFLDTSTALIPPLLKGVKVNLNDPFELSFIVDTGNSKAVDKADKDYSRLIRYFMAALTISQDDLWVNLSPYEANRIIPPATAATELGEGLLQQDYLLKQLASSLTYPENEVGRKYWNGIQRGGNSRSASTNNYNKVWIVPSKAHVVVSGNVAFIAEAKLKVMMEEDYLAMSANRTAPVSDSVIAFKTHILSLIEKEVNEGKTFAPLRQIYHSLILATWFKRNLKDWLLADSYYNRGKVKGIDLSDKAAKEKVYNRYLDAFKKGAYDYIKKERAQNKISQRRYFSGGAAFADRNMDQALTVDRTGPSGLHNAALSAQTGAYDTVDAGLVADGQESELSRTLTAVLDPDLDFADMENGAKEALAKLFGDKIVVRGVGINGEFGNPMETANCEIAIPVLGETFKISRKPQDQTHPLPRLEITAGAETIPFDTYLPRLQTMLQGPAYEAAVTHAQTDLNAKLKAAILRRDNLAMMAVVRDILVTPRDEDIRKVLSALSISSLSMGDTPARSYVYIGLIYALAELTAGRNGYIMPQDIREKHEALVKSLHMPFSRETYGLGMVLLYLQQNNLHPAQNNDLRQRFLEHLLFQEPQENEDGELDYPFTASEISRALAIGLREAQTLIDTLEAEGKVKPQGEGYSTNLCNIISATALCDEVVEHALARKYDYLNRDDMSAFARLLNIADGRILDYGYRQLFGALSQENKATVEAEVGPLIESVCRQIAGPRALKPIVQKYYPQIKAQVLRGLRSGYIDRINDTLLFSLEVSGVADDELAGVLLAILKKASGLEKDEDRDRFVASTRAKEILISSGRLIEDEPVATRLLREVAALNTAENLFVPADMAKIQDIPKVLERLRESSVPEDALTQAREIALCLAQSNLNAPHSQTRELLTYFLNELVDVAQWNLKIYGKMGGSFYRGLHWDAFQTLLTFLKDLDARLKESDRSENGLGLFKGVDDFIHAQEKPTDLVLRSDDLVQAESFPARYAKALDRDLQLALLQNEYELVGERITVTAQHSFLGSGIGGVMVPQADGSWVIGLRGVDHGSQGYILAHELLHIYLAVHGLAFRSVPQNNEVDAYLHELHNLIQDYLIEKEINRRFSGAYAEQCGESRDKELMGHLMGAGISGDFKSFMVVLTSHFAVSVYPQLNNSVSARFGQNVEGVPIERIKAALADLDISSSPESFRGAVLRIHALLTGDTTAHFDRDVIVVDEALTRETYHDIAEGFGKIKKVITQALAIGGGRIDRQVESGGVNFKSDALALQVDGKISSPASGVKRGGKNIPIEGLSEVISKVSPTDWRKFLSNCF